MGHVRCIYRTKVKLQSRAVLLQRPGIMACAPGFNLQVAEGMRQHPPTASSRPYSEEARHSGLQVVELRTARRSSEDVQAMAPPAPTAQSSTLPSRLQGKFVSRTRVEMAYGRCCL